VVDDMVIVRYAGWEIETVHPAKLPDPLPSRACQLQRTIDDLRSSLARVELVFVTWNNKPDVYAGAAQVQRVRQEVADLQAGRTPQTHILRTELASLAARPLKVSEVKGGE
jgi:hypothetical protein